MNARFLSLRFGAICLTVAAVATTNQFAAPATAALFAYDPFSVDGGPSSYLLGDDSTGVNVLGGQSPAIQPNPGFYSSAWIQSGGDAQAVFAGSLHYPLFPFAGGRVKDSVQFECCSFGRSGREISGGLGEGRFPRTIYQSFLVDFGNQGTDDPTQFGKRGVEWWNGGIGDSFKAVDLFVNHFNGTNEFTLEVTTPSGSQSALLNGGGLNLENMSGTHLVVMKFDFDPTLADVVSMYLDPTDSIESNWTPAAVVSAPNSDLIITHHGGLANFTFSGGGHNPGSFDEVRWGETFADVTPFVPEPGTWALGLAALVFAPGRSSGRSRRKRRG